jgi:alkanesulfonate monooxygenase SsuD/methylene tetrahydromethanopterin reductase-like flavin-dependent oxidoreductase (luciferase family)
VDTGEATNEIPLGFGWPDTQVRLARTNEAIQIIKKLWKGGGEEKYDDNGNVFIDFHGKYFHITNSKLYTPPSGNISLYIAAVG